MLSEVTAGEAVAAWIQSTINLLCTLANNERLTTPLRQRGMTRNKCSKATPYRPQEGHQRGDCKGDAWLVPEGQGFPLPTWASYPNQQLSWTTILVQQETATYEGNRLTSRRRNVFIPLRVFLLFM
jgi:hypothetical protein